MIFQMLRLFFVAVLYSTVNKIKIDCQANRLHLGPLSCSRAEVNDLEKTLNK